MYIYTIYANDVDDFFARMPTRIIFFLPHLASLIIRSRSSDSDIETLA